MNKRDEVMHVNVKHLILEMLELDMLELCWNVLKVKYWVDYCRLNSDGRRKRSEPL